MGFDKKIIKDEKIQIDIALDKKNNNNNNLVASNQFKFTLLLNLELNCACGIL